MVKHTAQLKGLLNILNPGLLLQLCASLQKEFGQLSVHRHFLFVLWVGGTVTFILLVHRLFIDHLHVVHYVVMVLFGVTRRHRGTGGAGAYQRELADVYVIQSVILLVG